MQKEPIVFDRYTERNLIGGTIVFDRQIERRQHIRFNWSAIRMMQIDETKNVQFVKIGDEWFVCATTLKRGYRLSKNGNNGLRVNAKIFIDRFLKDFRYSCKAAKFNIESTNCELAANPLFKISHSRIMKP